MLNKFNETYQDRGTIKWMGMYLSEHTASLEAEKKKLLKVVPVKKRMSSEDYEKGDLSLAELQDHLTGIGENESLEIGSNRLCFYLHLQTEGETFDYSQSVFAEWENSLSL